MMKRERRRPLPPIAAAALVVACNGTDDAGGHGGHSEPQHGSSCAGMSGTECRDGDCCASPPVLGGTFEQGEPDAFSSSVSSFSLDKYEVTVGRFRNFVAAYDAWRAAGNPASGSGANPSIPGSGWNESFGGSLPASASELSASFDCGDPTFQTWNSTGNDTLPMNCVDWYTSFAFCIWDGKRLPTESEWEYAAARGANDTLYPWGDTPTPDNSSDTVELATYACLGDGDPACAFSDILPVGSKPAGDGVFGQADLAGSMWEWNLDWFAVYPSAAQSNYASIDAGSTRVIRGGDWSSPASTLLAAARYSYGFPTARFTNVGLRCAGDAAQTP